MHLKMASAHAQERDAEHASKYAEPRANWGAVRMPSNWDDPPSVPGFQWQNDGENRNPCY